MNRYVAGVLPFNLSCLDGEHCMLPFMVAIYVEVKEANLYTGLNIVT